MSFSCVAKGCKTGLYIDAFMNIFKYITWEEDALSLTNPVANQKTLYFLGDNLSEVDTSK